MKKIVLLMAVLATAAIAATPAFASGTVTWTGQGSNNLPCSGNEHWVLSGNADVTGATLKFNGSTVATFSQSGGGSWSADTNLGVTSADIGDVTAEWTGTGTPHLVLSHCDTETGTTTTTTAGPTTTTAGPTTTTSGPTTTTSGPTTTTSGPTSTTAGPTGTTAGPTGTTAGPTGTAAGPIGTGGVSGNTTGGGTGGTTGGSAPTGGNLPFTGLPIWVPLLAAAALLASGVVLLRRKRADLS
jgi:hypothetical protein